MSEQDKLRDLYKKWSESSSPIKILLGLLELKKLEDKKDEDEKN